MSLEDSHNVAPPIRLVMLGTGDFALPTFLHLLKTGHQVVALVTQPDRPQGRKQEVVPSQIKQEALERGVRVEQPEDVNSPEGVALLRSMTPDLLVTAAYGQILSGELLGVAPLGGINLHGSVLPAYRGAAPVARAIQRGELETGVTVIRMSPRVDAGGMIAVARTPIEPDETAGAVEARLAQLGAPLVERGIAELVAGRAVVIPQDRALVSKAPKLSKEDGRIDWNRPARAVHDLVRAMQPWPLASTVWDPGTADRAPLRLIVRRTAVVPGEGKPGEVLAAGAEGPDVATASGAVRLLEVQVPGKRAVTGAEFARGYRIGPGDRLGEGC